LTRTNGALGNIQRITSPAGRYVEFTYDASNRITMAKDNKDNGGRTVTYEYDSAGRIWRVTDPMGGITEYTYDSSHRMLTLKDPRGIVYLTNEYTNGKVTKQTQADGSTYQFAYTTDASNNVIRTDVTDPRGNVKRVEFNADGHIFKVTNAVETAEEQVTDYERQAVSNLLLSVTDALEITAGVRRKTAYTYDALGNKDRGQIFTFDIHLSAANSSGLRMPRVKI
jgi:YD repeat-containing protein